MTNEERILYIAGIASVILYLAVFAVFGIYALNHPQVEKKKQYEQVKEEVIDDLIEYLELEKEQGK